MNLHQIVLSVHLKSKIKLILRLHSQTYRFYQRQNCIFQVFFLSIYFALVDFAYDLARPQHGFQSVTTHFLLKQLHHEAIS